MRKLFPAHAGVILHAARQREYELTVPRTRGGDFYSLIIKKLPKYCSPHTRG